MKAFVLELSSIPTLDVKRLIQSQVYKSIIAIHAISFKQVFYHFCHLKQPLIDYSAFVYYVYFIDIFKQVIFATIARIYFILVFQILCHS